MSSRLDVLDDRLKARIAGAIQGASAPIVFPGKAPALLYNASATTTSKFYVPVGALGVVLFTSSGFTSFTVRGRVTRFLYLNIGAATTSQSLQSSWAPTDDEAELTIVTGAGQSGSVYAFAVFTPLPTPAVTQLLQNAFPSLSRAAGTYTFDVPAQFLAKGIIVYSAVTAGTGTVTFAIQDRDANVGVTSNSYVTSAAIASGSGNILRMYPGLTTLANFDVQGVLGPTPRIVAVVSTNPATFATDYALLP